MPTCPAHRREPRGDMTWLLETTSRMLRCRSVAALLDLAYDAIRDGLGYDRVGVALADRQRRTLTEYIGTDEAGRKFYPSDRVVSLDEGSHRVRLLSDPRLSLEGPGFIYRGNAMREVPLDARDYLDGQPEHVLTVSLRTADTISGLMSVDNLISQRPICSDDAPPLVAFANALAVALENVTLLEERAQRIDDLDAHVRRQVSELEWLRDISQRLNGAVTLDEVLDIVYDGIRDGLGYDRVGIMTFDHVRGLYQECRGTDHDGHPMRTASRVESLAADSPIWRLPDLAAVLGGADFYHTDDALAETPPELRYLLDGAPAQQLAVPLRAGRTVSGMICVDNLISEQPITPEHAGPLMALANQVGTAIEKARLQERERAERVRLEVLLQNARALNSTLDREHILDQLTARLVGALDAASAAFTHLDFDARTCKSIAHHSAPGRPPLFTDDTWDALDRWPILEEVLRLQTTVCGHADDEALSPSERDFLHAHDLQTELLVPVVVRGQAAGVLEVHWAERTEVTADMMALCIAIAEQVAIALENARLYADATTRAERDALTGLPNRTVLQDRLTQALGAGPIYGDGTRAPVALLLMDLDRFKEINDTLGHHVGDLLLQQAGARLEAALRACDTVARLGGDEFAILLPATDADGAAQVARVLLAALEAPIVVEHQSLAVGASIGITVYPDHGVDLPMLLRAADVAMYVAKRTHNGYSIYAPDQDQHSTQRLGLTSALRETLDAGNLEVHYQPLVELTSNRLIGVEALARWTHPEHGFIAPDDFIPLAEQTGLIAPLTDFVLETALRQCRTWQNKGLHLGVSVNVSARTLHDARLPVTVKAVLDRHGIAPEWVTLEITESALMADPERALDVLSGLVGLGVSIAIDDFGTGYSSLGYLKRLPVHTVKIDKSFVLGLGADTSAPDAVIVRSVVAMAHAMGLSVVAEGVESAEAHRSARALGCDTAQGYLYSRPLPAPALEKWARSTPWAAGTPIHLVQRGA